MTDPVRVGTSIENLLSMMGAPPVSTVSTLTTRWEEIVGPALAARTRPIEMVDGVLVVGCGEASWASQIEWMYSSIKERFEAIFPGQVVRRIQVRVTNH